MKEPLYIAVDLGAGSGRVIAAGISDKELLLHEIRRFQYTPVRRNGHLGWHAADIISQIKAGLHDASDWANGNGRTVASLGVDSWGTDYGFVDADGRLCEDPVCYRDNRTQKVVENVFEIVPRKEIFSRTGIQFLVFNTIFQLAAHKQAGIPKTAVRLLMIPDLIHFLLTGIPVAEYTNATTTQMVSARNGKWDKDLLKTLGLPIHLLPDIVPAGTDLGLMHPIVGRELGLSDSHVVAPATHDTASAVVGVPLEKDYAYISSGTWSLVGVERSDSLINPDVERHNFTNEGGAFGTFRFLKNVMGLWILESCRREWQQRDTDIDYRNMLQHLTLMDECPGLIFPDDPRFLNPGSMLKAVADQLKENRFNTPEDPFIFTRVILDSLALRYASVLRTIEILTGQKIAGVHIVGGGAQNDYLNQATSTLTDLPVLAGPIEATAIGNIIVQAIRDGRFKSLSEARRHVAKNVKLKEFYPRPSDAWRAAADRYATIETHYSPGS